MAGTPGQVICLIDSIKSLRSLFTKIRDKNTGKVEFVRYANRLMHMICEEGISYVKPSPKTVTTPTGSEYAGCEVDLSSIVAVSIIRAADSMLDVFMNIAPEASVGKILIQRDEATAQPVLYYSKLPTMVGKNVVLMDPMLATGGSAKAAIKVLIAAGAMEENIMFLNVVACPEGIRNIHADYPKMMIVTGEIDARLDAKSYILPGLGDYGDRYFGTTN
jgi:uracil phosphoribosyltransferase